MNPNPQPQVEDGKISRQEARDLLRAIDKPEFAGLMDNYVKEISDPNNIKESNEFLLQSEKSNDLPPNVKLCKPTPGFCIRSEKYQIKRPSIRQKVFINICSYIDVPEPKSEQGNMWSLPYLLNKGRHDQDSKKKICTTFDVVFHPLALTKSKENISFKKYVCDTAISGINQKFLASQNEKISNDYIVKIKIDYKGLEVSYINIHSLSKGEMDDRNVPNALHKTQIMKEVEGIQKKNEEDKEEKVYDQPDVDNKDNVNEVIEIQKRIDKDNKKPDYKIKYSQDFELKNCFYQPEHMEDDSASFKKMIIEIYTPLMMKVSDADLEVDIKSVVFKYKDIYNIQIPLLVEIKKESVKAKFDQAKKMLSIILDIIQKEKNKPKKVEDENIEIVKVNEETERENQRKVREEEAQKKKDEEEKQKRLQYEREAKQKQMKLEEEYAKQRKENEVNKLQKQEERTQKESKANSEEEVMIKGIKQEKPIVDIKYKRDNNEENNGEETKEIKPLIEEIKKDDEDDLQTTAVSPSDNQNKENKFVKANEEQRLPLCLLIFNNEWVYEVE